LRLDERSFKTKKVLKILVSCFILFSFFLSENVSLAKSRSAKKKTAERDNSFLDENPDEPYSDDIRGDSEESYSSEDFSSRETPPIGISGGIGVGDGYYNINLTLAYYFNRWIGIDFSGFYQNDTGKNYQSVVYGPETDLIFRFPNRTIVTPFTGAGPGYEFWKRTKDDEVFDEASSLTANALLGLHLGLTKNFGLQVVQKWTSYLNPTPRTWDDHSKHEPCNKSHVQVGFIISL